MSLKQRTKNHIIFIKDKDIVIKKYGKKTKTWKSVKYFLLSALGFSIPIEYQSPRKRRDFERQTLLLWQKNGFNTTTEIIAPPNTDIKGVFLVEKFISGPTLKEILNDISIDDEKKLETIKSVYQEIRKRHIIAIYEEKHLLIHYDSNTRNIIISNNTPIFIDFEMGHLQERIDKSAVREIKKLTIEIANLIDIHLFPKLIDILFSSYGIKHILKRCAYEELHRKFYSYHITRDQKRKKNQPNLITKVDLAKKINNHLNPNLDTKKNHYPNPQKEVLESSWDGKFYQSFEDNDPRGRDMPHRYQIMQFPESFANKKVLDIGCNLGRICIDAAKKGAYRSVGIDYRQDVMDAVNKYCMTNNINAEFYQFDVNNGASSLKNIIGDDKFDIVFALAIWSHVDKQQLWDIINSTCNKVCYFEDNAPSRIKSKKKIKEILEANLKFNKIEFLGYTTDRGIRSVFRLSDPI